jgi:hypothetical protein
MPGPRGPRPHQHGDIDAGERLLGAVGGDHVVEQRKGAVAQLHDGAL